MIIVYLFDFRIYVFFSAGSIRKLELLTYVKDYWRNPVS